MPRREKSSLGMARKLIQDWLASTLFECLYSVSKYVIIIAVSFRVLFLNYSHGSTGVFQRPSMGVSSSCVERHVFWCPPTEDSVDANGWAPLPRPVIHRKELLADRAFCHTLTRLLATIRRRVAPWERHQETAEQALNSTAAAPHNKHSHHGASGSTTAAEPTCSDAMKTVRPVETCWEPRCACKRPPRTTKTCKR